MGSVRLFTTGEAPKDDLATIRSLLVAAFEGGFSEADWRHTLGGWTSPWSTMAHRSHAAVVA
jgi:hypothetical protein